MASSHKASNKKSSRRRRLLIRWQEAALKHPLLVHLGAAAILWFTFERILLYVIYPEASWHQELGMEFFIVLVSLAIPPSITYWSLRRELGGLLTRVGTIAPAQAINVVVRLISQELTGLIKHLEDLRGFGYTLDTEEVNEWVQNRCWSTMDGRYIGTSRHLPSKYMDILEGYLESHQAYLERTGWRDSVRIVFCEEEELKKDWKKNREKYEEFVNWHKVNNVRLVLLPWERAKRLARIYTPRGATDMGWWDGELILIWHYGADPGSGKLQLQVTFVGEDDYVQCSKFCKRAMDDKNARSFPADFSETPWGF